MKTQSGLPKNLTWHQALAALFLLALLTRVITALVVNLLFDSIILDDQTYTDMAQQKAAGETARWDAFTHQLYHQTSTLLVPLTLLYRIFGPVEIAGQLFVAVFGASTAVLVAALSARVIGRISAFGVGAFVALLPSQVLFSSVTLKDPLVWAVLVALALVLSNTRESRGWGFTLQLVYMAALLFALFFLRRHTLVIASAALVLSAWFDRTEQRTRRGLMISAVAIATPAFLGLGPLGLAAVPEPGSAATYRAAQTTGGSAGYSEKDAQKVHDTPPPATSSEGLIRDIRMFPRGLVIVLLEPAPWSSGDSARLWLAKLENLIWYPVLMLGLYGLYLGRKRLDVLAFPILVAGGATVVYALYEGNIGTAFRHRGEIVWAVAVLAGVAWHTMFERRRDSAAESSRHEGAAELTSA